MSGQTYPYDSPSHQAVKAFLMTRSRSYSLDAFKSQGRYRYCVRSESGLDEITVEIQVKSYPKKNGKFTIYAYAPTTVAFQRRQDLLEIFAETNFTNDPLKTELEPSTGIVRCGFAFYLMPDSVSQDHLAYMERNAVEMILTILPMLGAYDQEETHP